MNFHMAKRKKAAAPVVTPAAAPAVEEAQVATPAAEPVEEAEVSGTAITVRFRDHKGEPTERTFSKEVHGAGYKDLAEEFKKTHASKLIA